MIQAPEKLFQKASSLGFSCSTRSQKHFIVPSNPSENWQLVYTSGRWILLINGVAQMNLLYTEVTDFLERRSSSNQEKTALSV
jgi:hypothetical protein